jgi:hypothetical protein
LPHNPTTRRRIYLQILLLLLIIVLVGGVVVAIGNKIRLLVLGREKIAYLTVTNREDPPELQVLDP